MKKILVAAMLVGTAACTPAEEAAAPEEVAEAPAEIMAADGQPTPGNYKVTLGNGSVIMEEVRADGTYTATMEDGSTESGKWEQKTPELYCTTSDEEGAEQTCNEEMIDENGVWTSKDPETGESAVVERVVETAAE